MEIIIFALGFGIGWYFGIRSFQKFIRNTLKEMGVVENTPTNIGPICAIEKHGDVLYIFEKNTDQFLCQGLNLEELAINLFKYKNIEIALVEHDTESYWFVKGVIKKTSEVA